MTIHKRLTACQGLAYGWSLKPRLTIQASNVVIRLTEMFRTTTSGFGWNHPNFRASLATRPRLHSISWMQLATPVWAYAPCPFHLPLVFPCWALHNKINFIPFFGCAGPDVSGPDDLTDSCRFLCEDCSSRCAHLQYPYGVLLQTPWFLPTKVWLQTNAWYARFPSKRWRKFKKVLSVCDSCLGLLSELPCWKLRANLTCGMWTWLWMSMLNEAIKYCSLIGSIILMWCHQRCAITMWCNCSFLFWAKD